MKLNLRSVDLNLLPVFDAIMETGQLSLAGEQLGMSQPAVSAALHRLRDAMGDELFVRSHQGMRPTPRAKELYLTSAPVLDQLRIELGKNRSFEPALCQRHFHIMGGDYVEFLYYGPLLERLSAEAPQVSSEVSGLQVRGFEKPLLTGDMDVAVHYSPPTDSGLTWEKVIDDRLIVLSRKDHPRLNGSLSKEAFFTEQHVILVSPEGAMSHLDLFMGNAKDPRKAAARVTQFSSMIPVILNSDYLCVMPERLARVFGQRWELAMYPIPVAVPMLAIHLIWARRFQQDLAHAWFREQLKSTMLAIE